MNKESIIKQFKLIEASMHRAKLTFETDMLQKENIEVALYELIKSREQIENLVREMAPERFGIKTVASTSTIVPKLELNQLNICPNCGDPECTSDHK